VLKALMQGDIFYLYDEEWAELTRQKTIEHAKRNKRKIKVFKFKHNVK
jgi:hypothetical protein